MDDLKYAQYMKFKEQEWEAMCKRCGGCCGAFDDPCKHLSQDCTGRYYCRTYSDRYGIQETVSGDKFHCVHITEILQAKWKNDYYCAYKKFKQTPVIEVDCNR